MRGDRERLQDILEAIDKASRVLQRREGPFIDDEMAQVWAAFHIQVIGEAVSRLSSGVLGIANNRPLRL